jgi:hypothetical protein
MPVSESPIHAFLAAMATPDLDAALSLFAPEPTLGTAFGIEATGLKDVKTELGKYFAELRSAEHDVRSEWHPEPGVWIAELTATYELTDFSKRGPYRRAIIVRAEDDGIHELRIFGAHELRLSEGGLTYKDVRGPHGWLPTL